MKLNINGWIKHNNAFYLYRAFLSTQRCLTGVQQCRIQQWNITEKRTKRADLTLKPNLARPIIFWIQYIFPSLFVILDLFDMPY